MQKLKAFFNKKLYVSLASISILLAANMTFLANRKSLFSIFKETQNPDVFYVIFLILIATLAGIFFSLHRKRKVAALIEKLLLVFLPFEIALVLTILTWKPELNVLFFLFAGIYALSTSFLILNKIPSLEIKKGDENQTAKQWVRSQGKWTLTFLLFVMLIAGFFGTYNIGKFSAVDEPLWTFDRIPSFWKNIRQMNWNNTNISDKPGITVALVSGVGLTEVNPKLYDPKVEGSKLLDNEVMNKAFRLPILIFAVLSLSFFYFILERLLGSRSAILATSMIGLSPILIGMSRIINPDALLWIFAPLSLLSFLTYQKRRSASYLYLTGFLLGLSILTKYVANILYIFLFLMLFAEFIFNNHRYEKITLRKYLFSSIRDFLMITVVSLATFYAFYPGTWLKPWRLFEGTILSQAFTSTWPIFAAFFLLLIFDISLFKNKLIKKILNFLISNKNFLSILICSVFVGAVIIIFSNVYSGMQIFNFEEILASPKTSFRDNGFLALFFSNFYPLLFAVSPIAIIATSVMISRIILLHKRTKGNEQSNIIVFLILFIFSYYLGTTVNNVVSTSRYQIMLYPLLLIMSGISLEHLFSIAEKKYAFNKHYFKIFLLFVITFSAISLHFSKPFYLSYASSLLPNEHYLDLKDMGPGSYEVAEYLNSLPNAENLTIWTDKKGVCTFFKGHCYGDLSYKDLEGVSLDYVAVSWGRKSRTTSMVRSQSRLASHEVFNFAKYYNQKEDVVYELLVNNRPAQYIKVFKVNN
ncbi:MAG: hypothetical protein ACD_5C00031G0007 [uncultured bacterium]|nr:MAG: hypothetical protein ACD_5C00031G0007 [uncultured bacterium]